MAVSADPASNQLILRGGGGGWHSNTSVVLMHDQRNMKKGLFFETERNSQDLQLGVKMCQFFKEKGPFSILLGLFRGQFSNSSIPQNMFSKNILFKG